MIDDLLWIEAGQRFRCEALMHWQGAHTLEAQARRVDTIVLGPHASAAFPAELRPFIAPGLSRRQQCDFSDCSTAVLGRLWAEADEGVIFVENPHARLAMDANRASPADWPRDLREFFARLHDQAAGQTPSFSGIDAIRPISFAGQPVLMEPADAEAWAELVLAMNRCIAQGLQVYRQACAQVLQAVQVARPHAPIRVISLHDTMNSKMQTDGALVLERPAADRLPPWVNFGNLGDAQGEAKGPDHAVSLPADSSRRLREAWAKALNAPISDFSLNRPYKGGFETQHFGRLLAQHPAPDSGAIQVEFRREALLGPQACARLRQAGRDWPAADPGRLEGIAQALARAGQSMRAARA